MSSDRIYPPGTVPAFVAALGLLVGLAFLCSLAITRCSPAPVQMVPDAPQAVTATASAQVFATQSVRVTVKRAPTASRPRARQDAQEGPRNARQVSQDPTIRANEGDRGDEITIEVSQGVIVGATSSADASLFKNPAGNFNKAPNRPQSADSSHGRLGVALLTMPGILAADLQLVRLDASPVTRWLVDVPLEVGVDVVGNLEAGAVGVSVGGKAFALVGAWSRWNMGGQGVAIGMGLRF